MLCFGEGPLPELDLISTVRDSSVRGLRSDIEKIVELVLCRLGEPVVGEVGPRPVCKEHSNAKT